MPVSAIPVILKLSRSAALRHCIKMLSSPLPSPTCPQPNLIWSHWQNTITSRGTCTPTKSPDQVLIAFVSIRKACLRNCLLQIPSSSITATVASKKITGTPPKQTHVLYVLLTLNEHPPRFLWVASFISVAIWYRKPFKPL